MIDIDPTIIAALEPKSGDVIVVTGGASLTPTERRRHAITVEAMLTELGYNGVGVLVMDSEPSVAVLRSPNASGQTL